MNEMPYKESNMNGINNDYIAMKLSEARQRDLLRETDNERLVKLAVRRVKNVVLRKPNMKINHN
jgi:hypothetical protein